jgi:hypothetical protein
MRSMLTTPLPMYPRTVWALANMFSEHVRRALTEWELNEVRATDDGGPTCHTHDYTDANQRMLDAFEDVFGRPVDWNTDADGDVMEAAWTAARYWGFHVIPSHRID